MIPHHIWADDLTGAAEVADLLAARTGRTVSLALGDAEPASADIVVRDLDLRHTTDAAARTALRARLRHVPVTERIFLKIDSQLHGPVAGLAGAMLDGGRSLVLCAANPTLGRVVIDGRHQVPSATGPVTTSMTALLAAVPHQLLTRDDARPTPGGEPLVLAADAQSEGDLDALASTAVDHGLDGAGAAALLAALLGPAPAAAPAVSPPGGALIAVVGSTEAAAHAQLDAAAAHPGVEVVEAHPRQLAEAIATADEALRGGRSVVLSRSSGTDALTALTEVAATVIARRDAARTVALLTGGHTARLVLDRLAITALTVIPGALDAAVRLQAPSGLTVITKPGSYGSADAVVALHESLHPVPHEEPR
ncbi:four-carbon acid sugar kinase family protein [Pseudactinotalea sp.]|uniref:four-carbon acid sugar kinase family protein n=1 Tax=Pseudactinotalea sp. TaxID=1926260 RepID=UPI003B3AED32